MRKHKLIIALCTVLLGLGACSQSDDLPPVVTGDEVLINLSAGEQNLSVTRANNFAPNVPVTVLVFKRTTAGTPADVTGVPYRTFKAKTSGNTLAPVAAGDKLTVLSGFTYDFYAFANPKTELTSGTMAVAHGTDLLVGSVLGKAIAKTDASVTVDFGDLPHLGSQVQFTAYPNTSLPDGFADGVIQSFGVSKVTWSKLPLWGSLTLNPAAAVQKLVTSTTYTSKFELVPTTQAGIVSSTPKWSVGDKGVILPFPLAVAGRDFNRINMQFEINVNGGGVLFEATDVEVPAFDPAKSYKFSMELQAPEPGHVAGSAELYLSVVGWNSLEWVSGMGGDGGVETIIKVGSWSTVNWNAGMGGDNSSPITIIGVSGWRSLTWDSVMGM